MQRHVEENLEKGIFDTVTGTFQKFILTGQYDANSRPQLVSINNPHWLAKRDAAYHAAVFLIKNGLVSKPVEQRRSNYGRVISLLHFADEANQKVQACNKGSQVDFISKYLRLLTDLLTAACSLADVDIILASREDNSIWAFVGSKDNENLINLGLTCMEDEKKLHESVVNLITVLKEPYEKEEIRSKKELDKVDQVRYDEAFAELKAIYKKEISNIQN